MEFINIIFDKIVTETTSFIVERNESDGGTYLCVNGHEDSIYVNQEPWLLFNHLENEVSENLSVIVDIKKERHYLNSVLESLNSNEEKIIQIKSFWQAKDITYKNCSNDSFSSEELERLSNYFFKIKQELRKCIVKLSFKLDNLSNNQGLFFKYEFEWNRDKTDLIELAKALSLCGAIKKSGKLLNFTEAYQLFGNLFNLELKSPDDQLRHRAETKDTPNFLEELLENYMEDQKILKKKRES